MPVSRPKEWNESPYKGYAIGAPVLTIPIEACLKETLLDPGLITSHIMNHFMVKNACLTQLAKCTFNEFRIGIDDIGLTEIRTICLGYKPFNRDGTGMFTFSASHIWLFQRNPKDLPKKLD
jgi:hypothetical protein